MTDLNIVEVVNERARKLPTQNIEGTCREPTLYNNIATIRDFAAFSQFKITIIFLEKRANEKIAFQVREMQLNMPTMCKIGSNHYFVLLKIDQAGKKQDLKEYGRAKL